MVHYKSWSPEEIDSMLHCVYPAFWRIIKHKYRKHFQGRSTYFDIRGILNHNDATVEFYKLPRITTNYKDIFLAEIAFFDNASDGVGPFYGRTDKGNCITFEKKLKFVLGYYCYDFMGTHITERLFNQIYDDVKTILIAWKKI